ncbi:MULTISPECIES: M16 family metallopeptidase [Vibrio]|uniref:M16 family metallopeptidase n=1 Tax=Vibrio TaxID=662 RepID=UPI000BFFAC89|nr:MULTISPECIES: pitrilysin family protein [unclassified Vibrio]PHJ41392.1 peptidase M16 [Vibrio sp. PID17_43]RIZ57174.1 peptidase M16 [Vibrio sp. PID23_8]
MRMFWVSTCSLLVITGCASNAPVSLPDGVTFVESSKTEAGKVKIPYQKYQLDNGLTVILAPEDSDPLVHVDVTYHVGSAREDIGKSGFAHFFEHMMFQGSENVGDQQHFKIITEAGGTLNGTTNRDRTNYFETVPANQLEKMLWLESDRMGFLLDAVSQEKFEIQRSTVKNERAQRYDNRPYGLIWERMAEALYPEGHPYSWQTIGYVEDLDRVDVNDLKAFFLRWYGPNNAVITIGGDIDVEQTLAWVNKYFGSIPRGPEVDNAPKQPAKLEENKFITLEDRIQQPMVMIAWPTTYSGEANQASLDTLSSVLGSGTNSLLYQDLVKTQKAVDAGSFHDCAELSCNFYVYAMGDSGEKGDLSKLYDELMQSLNKFSKEGVTKDRLDQLKGQAEADAIFALESVKGKVTQLASNQTFFGQPDLIEKQLEQIRAVRPESVEKAYSDFIQGKNKVTLSVVPKGKVDLAVKPATFVTPKRTLPEYQKITDDQLAYRRATDNFERSVQPPAGAPVEATMPKLYGIHFDNGSELLGTVSTETPTVMMQFSLPAGTRFVDKGKEGLAQLTAAMLQEGTTKRSVEDIQAELDKLGSMISVEASGYTTNISVSSLAKNLAPTLKIVEEMLLSPAFKEEDFERVKVQALEGLVYEQQNPSWMASQASRQVLYGDSVFARPKDGTQAGLNALTLNDVRDFYTKHYTPQSAQIVVVGDISKQDIQKQLAFWSSWEDEAAPLYAPQSILPLGEQKIHLVDKPGAPQSVVMLVRQGMPYDATGDFYLSQLANFNLSGNFNSRINQNLREDKGYTYGAFGYFSGNVETGSVVFTAQVRADSTVASIVEMENELNEYSQAGMTDDEMTFMRQAVGQKDALKYETPTQKGKLISDILKYNLDKDYLQQRNAIVDTVDKRTLDALAQKWFDPNDYQIVVVGDAKSLRPQLEKLGKDVEELEIIR